MIPIQHPPIQESCEYEMLREKNIKEKDEAMEASGFFRDLYELKKDIGIVQNSKY